MKKETHSGYTLRSMKFPLKVDGELKQVEGWGMIIPTSAIKRKKYLKICGYSVLWMWRWMGIRKYELNLPVRTDLVIDFLFWRLVKPKVIITTWQQKSH